MQDRFLLLDLPLLLCLVPLALTASSWQLGRYACRDLTKSRKVSFRAGLVFSAVALLATASCWIDPYHLVQTPDGGYSIAWFDRAWAVAFIAPIISMILALSGQRLPRILLFVSDVLTLVLAFGSLLQNGV